MGPFACSGRYTQIVTIFVYLDILGSNNLIWQAVVDFSTSLGVEEMTIMMKTPRY